MIRQGIAEDLLREEFSAGDAARSINALQHLDPQLDSAQKVSDATGIALKTVARSLQLGHAPAVVQEATLEGMMVDVDGDGDESAHQQRRKLTLLEALEFARLQGAVARTETAKRDEDGRERHGQTEPSGATASASTNQSTPHADRQTRKAIERALAEDWSFRQVKRYVDKAIAAMEAPAPKKNVGGRPRVPFRLRKRRLQLDLDQLDALDASQKAELRKVIEDILRRL